MHLMLLYPLWILALGGSGMMFGMGANSGDTRFQMTGVALFVIASVVPPIVWGSLGREGAARGKD